MTSPIRIRRRIDSTTVHVAELAPYIGRQMEIVVLDEHHDTPHLAVTRGLLKSAPRVGGDPVADTLAELRAQRAAHLDKLVDDLD